MRIALVAGLTFLPWMTGAAPTASPAVAYPRLIAFYGGPLAERRVLTDQAEIVRFLEDLGPAIQPDSVNRDSTAMVRVALYWYNPMWEAYARDTAMLARLPFPSDTVRSDDHTTFGMGRIQPGRLYLATASQVAAIDCGGFGAGSGLNRLGPTALGILRAHRIPTSGP